MITYKTVADLHKFDIWLNCQCNNGTGRKLEGLDPNLKIEQIAQVRCKKCRVRPGSYHTSWSMRYVT